MPCQTGQLHIFSIRTAQNIGRRLLIDDVICAKCQARRGAGTLRSLGHAGVIPSSQQRFWWSFREDGRKNLAEENLKGGGLQNWCSSSSRQPFIRFPALRVVQAEWSWAKWTDKRLLNQTLLGFAGSTMVQAPVQFTKDKTGAVGSRCWVPQKSINSSKAGMFKQCSSLLEFLRGAWPWLWGCRYKLNGSSPDLPADWRVVRLQMVNQSDTQLALVWFETLKKTNKMFSLVKVKMSWLGHRLSGTASYNALCRKLSWSVVLKSP